MVKRKIDMVYGGGSVGFRIIPKALMPIEISGETYGDVRVVEDMHERKAAMVQEAEAFIALPGERLWNYGGTAGDDNMGTAWYPKKTVGVLNVDGYYNNLLALSDTGVEEGFIKPGARNIIVSAPFTKNLNKDA